MTEYTFTDLTISTTYTISVSAINAAGESPLASISVVAASVPSKMSAPTLSSASTSSITVTYSAPSFNGGSAITSYMLRIDSGPLTSYNTPVSTTLLTNTFSSLSSGVLYKIQVSAVNSIGQGDYSESISVYAAGSPGEVATFTVASQS